MAGTAAEATTTTTRASNSTAKGRYWLGTINEGHGEWSPPESLPDSCVWLRGQQEIGASGNRHWQIFAAFSKNVRLNYVKRSVGEGHWELSRSQAAEDYVWKEETRVEGTQFELGSRALKRNSKTDWALQLKRAKEGKIDEIDPDIQIRYYSTLKKIAFDNSEVPTELPDVCGLWIWGEPGIGKSRKARADYPNIFPKPLNKWWDGYAREENVLLDDVDHDTAKWIGHFLKIWADRYPFLAEIKGGTMKIRPKNIVVTSNYSIQQLWPVDLMLQQAILRRFKVIHLQDGWRTLMENRNNQ